MLSTNWIIFSIYGKWQKHNDATDLLVIFRYLHIDWFGEKNIGRHCTESCPWWSLKIQTLRNCSPVKLEAGMGWVASIILESLFFTSLFNTSCINFTIGDHTQHRPIYPISPKAGLTSSLKTILVSADTCKCTPGLASNLLLLRFQQWFMVCRKRIASSTQIHTENLRIKHVFVTIFCICSFLI